MVRAYVVVLLPPYLALVLNEHEATGAIRWRQSVDTEGVLSSAHGRPNGSDYERRQHGKCPRRGMFSKHRHGIERCSPFLD